jgi:hypothetical protein
MIESNVVTLLQPTLVLDNIIYLPVYHRPTSKRFWISPSKQLYTTEELVEEFAQLEMRLLWARYWLADMVEVNDHMTHGEIKRLYSKALGIL